MDKKSRLKEELRLLRSTEPDRDYLEKLPKHTNSLHLTNNKIEPYKKVNEIIIPEDATNGDVIKAMFPKAWGSDYIDIFNKFTLYIDDDHELEVDIDWWNAPYKKEVEE